MGNKKIALVVIATLVTAGCATMEAGFESPKCSFESGYRLGVNDANTKRAQKQTVGDDCSKEKKLLVQRGYRDGYSAGAGRVPATTPKTQQPQ